MRPTFHSAILLVGLSALSTLGCATESTEDTATGGDAVSTPRAAEEKAAAARLDELRVALDEATPADFGESISPAVRPFFDEALVFFSEADADPAARVYSFAASGKKAYVVETHPARSKDLVTLYVYDAVYGDGRLAHLFDERTPNPLGRCAESTPGGPLRCVTVADGARLYTQKQ